MKRNVTLLVIVSLGLMLLPIISLVSPNVTDLQRVNSSLGESEVYTSAWIANGTAVCVETGEQSEVRVCSDEDGGAFIVWTDYRNGLANGDIYMQRVNSTGYIQWDSSGVGICTLTSAQLVPEICYSGNGNAIIVWQDIRGASYDLYAQKIDASGTPQWTTDGIPICTSPNNQNNQKIIPDGTGGAIVVWNHWNGADYDLYTQKVNSTGGLQWQAGGVVVSNATNDQDFSQICSDGLGGAIITWTDLRDSNYDIYAQRIASNGTTLWPSNGTAIAAFSSAQAFSTLCLSGNNAIISWLDDRDGDFNYDVYAQKINLMGVMQWNANGIPVANKSAHETVCRIVADGQQGAIIVWEQEASMGVYDIYAQRINSAGSVLWSSIGVAVCTDPKNQVAQEICADGNSGSVIVWDDYRGATIDIYMQHLNSNGQALEQENGTAICSAVNTQQMPQVSLGVGRAFIVWQDNRSSDNGDVYLQQLLLLDSPQLTPILPNPNEDGIVTLNWNLVSGATQYYIFRSISSIKSIVGLTPIKTTTTNSSVDNIITDNTYYYVIIANKGGLNSTPSNCESVVVTIPPGGGGIPGFEFLPLVVGLLIAVYLSQHKRRF